MEYIYTAMLLHSAGQKITEENIEKVLKAANIEADPTRIKALAATLEGVDIDEAISKSFAMPSVQAPPPEKETEKKEGKKEEKKKEEKEKVSEEEAAAGLGALFG